MILSLKIGITFILSSSLLRSLLSLLFPRHGLDEEKAKLDPAYHLKSTNLETRETLAELYRDYKGDQLLASTSKEPEAKKTDKLNAVRKHSSDKSEFINADKLCKTT